MNPKLLLSIISLVGIATAKKGPHGAPMCNGCIITGTGGDKSLWGWENNVACEIDTNKCKNYKSDKGPHGAPLCTGCVITGTGGDKSLWGWENNVACEIDTKKCKNYKSDKGPHGAPLCTGCVITGTGGDKSLWGWENNVACEIDTDKCKKKMEDSKTTTKKKSSTKKKTTTKKKSSTKKKTTTKKKATTKKTTTTKNKKATTTKKNTKKTTTTKRNTKKTTTTRINNKKTTTTKKNTKKTTTTKRNTKKTTTTRINTKLTSAAKTKTTKTSTTKSKAKKTTLPVYKTTQAQKTTTKTTTTSSKNSSPTSKVIGQKRNGKTTRYWDCCKPSCSWNGKANVSHPVNTCKRDGSLISDVNARSGCDGGEAFACTDQQPWAINDKLSYGFAAAHISGGSESSWCCACYRLTFTNTSIKGKQFIVQVTNTGGDLGENHFDLQIPGGGLGIFDGCSSQFNTNAASWGERYGGVRDVSGCNNLPKSLQAGCKWRFNWFENADNPNMEFEEVECPSELVAKTGCRRL